MERKLTAQTALSCLIPVVLLGMFMLRSHYCREFFPMMVTDKGDWDGANTFTMNVFSVMFLLAFGLIPFYKRTLLSAILVDILIGVSLTDVGDRFVFNITSKTEYDLTVFVITVFIILLDQLVIKKYARKKPV
jgi:hypothetical protein